MPHRKTWPLDRKITSIVTAIENGGDLKLLTAWLNQLSAERDAVAQRAPEPIPDAKLEQNLIIRLHSRHWRSSFCNRLW